MTTEFIRNLIKKAVNFTKFLYELMPIPSASLKKVMDKSFCVLRKFLQSSVRTEFRSEKDLMFSFLLLSVAGWISHLFKTGSKSSFERIIPRHPCIFWVNDFCQRLCHRLYWIYRKDTFWTLFSKGQSKI